MEEQKLERRITEELVALSEYSIESKAPLQCVRIMGIIRAHTAELLSEVERLTSERDMFDTMNENQRVTIKDQREQIKSLKKENDRQSDLLETLEDIQKVLDTNKSLTEQVENAKKETWDQTEKVDLLANELSRLREREKELVEALRFCFENETIQVYRGISLDKYNEFKSLLSKVKQ